MARESYTDEFRRQAVDLYESTPGATLRAIADDMGSPGARWPSGSTCGTGSTTGAIATPNPPTGRPETAAEQVAPARGRGRRDRELREDIEAYRQPETQRLDALQHALWGRAMTGDIDAVREVHRIIVERCRVLGLLGPARPTRSDWRPQTVVLSAEDCEALGL